MNYCNSYNDLVNKPNISCCAFLIGVLKTMEASWRKLRTQFPKLPREMRLVPYPGGDCAYPPGTDTLAPLLITLRQACGTRTLFSPDDNLKICKWNCDEDYDQCMDRGGWFCKMTYGLCRTICEKQHVDEVEHNALMVTGNTMAENPGTTILIGGSVVIIVAAAVLAAPVALGGGAAAGGTVVTVAPAGAAGASIVPATMAAGAAGAIVVVGGQEDTMEID